MSGSYKAVAAGLAALAVGFVAVRVAARQAAAGEKPGTIHRVNLKQLPAPYATKSAGNPPRVVDRPADAKPQALPGYTVSLFADNLENPRLLRTAPNGDLDITARVRAEVLLTRTYEEAAQNSRTRRAQIAAWNGQLANGGFGWVTPPILNSQTRLAVELCPAHGVLRAVGYEPVRGQELPVPATLLKSASYTFW